MATDASRSGIGFALIQQSPEGPAEVIQCGSRSLTPAEKNYAIIELEALAIAWAIKKAEFYLRGIPHGPPVFDGGLYQIPRTNGQQMPGEDQREDRDFSFDMVWKPGKDNVIADALSRSWGGGIKDAQA